MDHEHLFAVNRPFEQLFVHRHTLRIRCDIPTQGPYLTIPIDLVRITHTVNWSNFIGGPPVIAAETGGSVDLGDMAETPTVFAQSAGDPVKVVAVTQGANPKISPYDIVVPAGSPIKTAAQLKGQTVAVQEGTVEQYFLVQYLAKSHIALQRRHTRQPGP